MALASTGATLWAIGIDGMAALTTILAPAMGSPLFLFVSMIVQS